LPAEADARGRRAARGPGRGPPARGGSRADEARAPRGRRRRRRGAGARVRRGQRPLRRVPAHGRGARRRCAARDPRARGAPGRRRRARSGILGAWTGARVADGLEVRRDERTAPRRRICPPPGLAETPRAARARAEALRFGGPRGPARPGRRARRRRQGRARPAAMGCRDPARRGDARPRPRPEPARGVTLAHRNGGSLVGVFGGTFDPVHVGHLRVGLELLERAGLREVRFIPAARPPHRAAPETPAALRLAMLESAIAEEPRIVDDRRAPDQPGTSYPVCTLELLATQHTNAAWCLLLGMDAFLGLPEWHRWTDLLELAHVVVAHRPGVRVPDGGALGRLVRERRTASAADLTTARAGRIHIEPVTQLDISATGLRAAVRAGRDPRYLVPDAVRRIIFETECYAEKQTEDAKG